MTWKWFLSRTVRQATHAARHVRKIVDHQRDILSVEAIAAVEADIAGVERAADNGSTAEINESVAKLEKSANKWLKPYPNAAWRENVEVMLVAIAVAMGIRTFFLQPFKIPTGSMQPTLYGVTDENLVGRTDFKMPGAFAGLAEYWFRGVSYKHVVSRSSGRVHDISQPTRFILFNLRQSFFIGDDPKPYVIWFPPDNMMQRAGIADPYGGIVNHEFQPGEDVIKLRIISGDHLFVDRVSYNFRRPNRGDIVVFETHGIEKLSIDQQDTYYIKRLCGLGGESLTLTHDFDLVGIPRYTGTPVGHLVVNGREITASTPHFENLYAFMDAERGSKTIRYHENHYYGHALLQELEPGRKYNVPRNHYFVMGDNTMNSSDSRIWGDFPQERVIGKSFFVYWPIGAAMFKGEERPSRFGWAHR